MLDIRHWSALILSLLALPLFVSCASGPSEIVGKVGKNRILREEYIAHRNHIYSNFAEVNSMHPTPAQRRDLSNQAFQRFVDGYFLQDLYDKHHITVSPREVLDALRNDIPDFIRISPRFHDDKGQFDMDLYIRSLQTDRPENLSTVREIYRTSVIPQQKLQRIVTSQRRISDKEIVDLYNLKYSEAEIKLYEFTVDDISVSDIKVSDDEVMAYYNEQRALFYVEPSLDMNWVFFALRPSESDLKNIASLADSLYNEIKKGRPFSNLARDYSAQPYARLGGDAGIMQISEFAREIQEQLRNASIGDLLPPFVYDNAWWIIKVNDRTPNTAKLNIIKLDIKPSIETRENHQRQMARFVEIQNIIGFARTADELNMTMHRQTGLSETNTVINGIGDIEPIINRSMNLPEKTIHTPIMVPDTDDYVVFQIDKKTAGYYRTIYEVWDEIYETLVREKIPQAIVDRAKEDLPVFPSTIIHIEPTKHFTLTYAHKDTYKYEFILETLGLNIGMTSSVHFDKDKAYFAQVWAKWMVDDRPPLESQRAILKAELQSLNQEQYFRDWLAAQRRRLKVVDKRIPSDF